MSCVKELACAHKDWKDHLRWRKPVESQQKQHEPEDGVNYLDGKLGGCEQERE